ncbi:raftlin isoform X2 [Dendrobates tinctorius]
MFRVVLIKKTERNLTGDQTTEEYSLDIEPCMSSDQQPDQKLIPDLVKRIEDAASQGSKFAGIVQGYYIPKDLPYSLSDSLSQTSSPEFTAINKASSDAEDHTSADKKSECTNGSTSPAKSRENAEQSKTVEGLEVIEPQKAKSSPLDDVDQLEELNFSVSNEDVFVQDKIMPESTMPDNCSSRKSEILALFNKPKTQQRYRKYYTVKIPMKITREKNAITGLEANWLEYMTDHFRKGCSLVNAVFYLGMINDISSEFTDGVFIFEDFPEQDPKTVKRYDAIVVEQCTIIEGFNVHTDYMPLLTSLAVYGWQLTCVLSTPIVKTSRDGNVTTKQIVFMQRPTLPHKNKKKEPKFHLRFSKDEKRSKYSKKTKGKVNFKDNETDRNKRNEEQTKADDAEDIHGNHQLDGNILQKTDGLQEDVITQQNNEAFEEAPLLSKENSSPLVEGSTESIKNEESDGTKTMEEESSGGVVGDRMEAENSSVEGDVDTQLMEKLNVEDTN